MKASFVFLCLLALISHVQGALVHSLVQLRATGTLSVVAAGSGPGKTLTFTPDSTVASVVAVFDNFFPQNGYRILIANQNNAVDNGIYTCGTFGDITVSPWVLTRATDSDNAAELTNIEVFVQMGAHYANTVWVLNAQAFFGVDAGPATYFSDAANYAIYQFFEGTKYWLSPDTWNNWGIQNSCPTVPDGYVNSLPGNGYSLQSVNTVAMRDQYIAQFNARAPGAQAWISGTQTAVTYIQDQFNHNYQVMGGAKIWIDAASYSALGSPLPIITDTASVNGLSGDAYSPGKAMTLLEKTTVLTYAALAATNPIVMCSTYSDTLSCTTGAVGCYWDADLAALNLAACYSSIAVVTAQYPCTTWTSAAACADHYCSYTVSTATCAASSSTTSGATEDAAFNAVTQTAGTVDGYSTSTSWSNARMTAGSTVFRVDVYRPVALMFCNPGPAWPIISVGDGLTSIADMILPGFGTTNTLTSGSPVCGTPLSLSQQAEVQTFYQSYIELAYEGDVTFGSRYLTAGAANTASFTVAQLSTLLAATLGFVNIAPAPITTSTINPALVENISLSADGLSVVYSVAIDLDRAASLPASRGVSVSNLATMRSYILPMTVLDHSVDDSYFTSTITFNPTVTTTGSVVVEASTRYPTVVYIKSNRFVESVPGDTTQQYQEYTIVVEFHSVYDANIVVGPRSISDIIVNGQPLPNIYQTVVKSFAPTNVPTYDAVNKKCSYTIVFRDAVRTITSDGNAFVNAGSPYSASQNGFHPFWMNVYTTTSLGVSTLANHAQTIGGATRPDQVSITLSEQVYPALTGAALTTSLVLLAGLLPTPTSGLASANWMTDSNGNQVGSFDMNNLQLTYGKSLTIILAMNDTQMRTVYDLRIALSSILITPIDDSGAVITGLATSSWTNVARCATYVPKNRMLTCASCMTNPACNGIIGCDAVTIPAQCLYNLYGTTGTVNPGFRLDLVGHEYYMNTASAVMAVLPATRRLLSFDSPTPVSTNKGRRLLDDGPVVVVAAPVIPVVATPVPVQNPVVSVVPVDSTPSNIIPPDAITPVVVTPVVTDPSTLGGVAATQTATYSITFGDGFTNTNDGPIAVNIGGGGAPSNVDPSSGTPVGVWNKMPTAAAGFIFSLNFIATSVLFFAVFLITCYSSPTAATAKQVVS